ncbi:MAG: hypothetical protein O6944_08165 [Gammaproteobacteria bacterium]|nr:hypothetical protein [Gammaproteobacteria bacterium]
MNKSAGPTRMLAKQLGKLYSRIPDPLDRVLLKAYRRIRENIPRWITVERVSGYDIFVNKPISILLVGSSPASEYFLHRLIGKKHSREQLGRPDRGDAVVLVRERRHHHDLAIIQGPRSWTDTAFDAAYWRVPAAIGNDVNLQFATGKEPWINNSNRPNLHRIRKHGFVRSISHAQSDFEYFYHRMYMPYIRERFGEFVQARSEHRMRRYFRSGALIWASLGSQRLAATLINCADQRATSWIFAPNPERQDAVKMGAISATYLFSLEWAIEQEMHRLNLGPSRACLLDGVLRYKKHWGASLVEDRSVREDLLFSWQRMTPAIFRFLHESPLVVRQGNQFAGLTAIVPGSEGDAGKTEVHLKSIAEAGLSKLIVIATATHNSEFAQIKGIPIRWLPVSD